jgi:hypothetical protein
MEEVDLKIAKAAMVKACCDAVRVFMEESDMYDCELRIFSTRGYTQTPDGKISCGLSFHVTEDSTSNDDIRGIEEECDEDD